MNVRSVQSLVRSEEFLVIGAAFPLDENAFRAGGGSEIWYSVKV